jgi:hypothetical protein
MQTPRIISILLFNDSRKAGIGLWLFLTAHALLIAGLIKAGDWVWATTTAAALVGGGTVLDKLLANRRPPKPGPH